MKVPCPCKVYICDGKGSNLKGYFFQNKWALSCLYAVINNDISPTALQLFSESFYLHQWSFRLHKCPSLPHLTPPPWKHLNWALSVPLFALVSVMFFTESDLVLIGIGTSNKPANIISFTESPWQQPVFWAPSDERGVILKIRNGWLWHTLTSCGWSACQDCGVDLTKCCMNQKWINLSLAKNEHMEQTFCQITKKKLLMDIYFCGLWAEIVCFK